MGCWLELYGSRRLLDLSTHTAHTRALLTKHTALGALASRFRCASKDRTGRALAAGRVPVRDIFFMDWFGLKLSWFSYMLKNLHTIQKMQRNNVLMEWLIGWVRTQRAVRLPPQSKAGGMGLPGVLMSPSDVNFLFQSMILNKCVWIPVSEIWIGCRESLATI